MRVTLRTRPATQTSGLRRVAFIGAAFLLAGGLAGAITTVAGAEPQPTIASVQAEINSLTSQFDKADQQYDQVEEQLTAAKTRLDTLDKQLAYDEKQYQTSRKQVVQIADSSYEDSAQTSLAGLLTSSDPAQVLGEASIIEQITGTRNLETQDFLAAASQLTSIQQEQQHTEQGIAQLAAQKAGTKNHIATLLSQQKSILNSLDAAQQAAVEQQSVGSGGTTSAVDTVPTSTQAGQAVAYVFAQLGCPYVYGATGPCSDGFDCSGLVMEAWASAGISIPRDTYEQWAALPHISSSDIEPGDLLYYNGIGHVAMYVGNGMIIDAPTTGEDVEEIPMDTSWYADNFDGAARP